MTAPKIANADARRYVQNRQAFKGSNIFAHWHTASDPDKDRYVVYSYGEHWPLFVWVDGQWYRNSGKYSVTTSKHSSQTHPHPNSPCVDLTPDEIVYLASRGMGSFITKRLTHEAA